MIIIIIVLYIYIINISIDPYNDNTQQKLNKTALEVGGRENF